MKDSSPAVNRPLRNKARKRPLCCGDTVSGACHSHNMNSRSSEHHPSTPSMFKNTTTGDIRRALVLLIALGVMGIGCRDSTTDTTTTLPPPKGLPPVPTHIPEPKKPEPTKLEKIDYTIRDANGNPVVIKVQPLDDDRQNEFRSDAEDRFATQIRRMFPDRQLSESAIMTIASIQTRFFDGESTSKDMQAIQELLGVSNLELLGLALSSDWSTSSSDVVADRERALTRVREEIQERQTKARMER